MTSVDFTQFRPTQAVIQMNHLKHNLNLLRSLPSSKKFFCPMIKANAYGHGDVVVAKELERAHVTQMGVGLIEEGLLLRKEGIRSQLLFYGLMDLAGAKACLEKNLTPVLSSWDQIQALAKASASTSNPIHVHLKFDTGMHRLGFEPSESPRLLQYFEDHPRFILQGVLTHLACGEDIENDEGESARQLRMFENLCRPFQKWNPVRHALNSAGLFGVEKLQKKQGALPLHLEIGTRPGLALYGVSPLSPDSFSQQLKPVMSLRSSVIRVKKIEVGEGVSYGFRFRAKRTSWVGIVPVGYADGYHRLLSGKAEVLIQGKRAPVLGSVCMDYFMIDLTDLVGQTGGGFEALVGQEVTLFGYDQVGNLLGPQELADRASTIVWEILTSVGERVPRIIESGVG